MQKAYDQGFKTNKESTNTLSTIVISLTLGFIANAA
jgi:hypothetical protein